MTQKKKALAIVGVAIVVVAVMFAAWINFGPNAVAGEKDLGLTIVYADGASDEMSFTTSAEFLRQALEEQDLIEGDESEYGLFVTTVNGVKADDANQEWWCFTRDGEMLMTGVDSTPIADGEHYEITLTIGY